MNDLTQWNGHPVIYRLGWTLLHFLWQGAVVAGLFYFARILVPKRFCNARYCTGCLALLLMLAAPIFTFISLETARSIPLALTASQSTSNPPNLGPHTEAANSSGPSALGNPNPNPNPNPISAPALHIEKFLPVFVFAWLLGVSALSLRLLLSSLHVARLRRHENEPLGEPWITRLDRLKAALQVSVPVRLVKSALVEVPTVIGWLRPVILLPATSLTGLTALQLESILAHELAHVRRYDYLVNLLQNVLEALLFYHPAVWWVSSCVRAEREVCCDEIAVQQCRNRLAYAEALTTLEELRLGCPSLALGADGGSLLERIRRLSGASDSGSFLGRCGAGGALVAALLAFILISLAIKQVEEDKIPRSAAVWETLNFTRETLKAVPPQVTILRSKFSPDKEASFWAGTGMIIGSYSDPKKTRHPMIAKEIQLDARPRGVLEISADPATDTRCLETDTNFETAQLIGIGVSVEQILLMANGIQDPDVPGQRGGTRVLNPGWMPVGRYDFIANLPTGSRAALADLVKRQFGYVGTRTNIVVPYFVLKFDHDGAPGLKPASPSVSGDPKASFRMSIEEIINMVQPYLGGYITDETGLTGKFDFDWSFLNQFHQSGRFYESLLKRQQQRFLQDLGLQLILTNKISTEYFQISKVN
jgi:uncharacterized protein (TIGR03435 family)